MKFRDLNENTTKKLKHGSNRGAVNEFLIGSAVVAKFEAGMKPISQADVIRVAKETVASGKLSHTFEFENNEQTDKVVFQNIISNQQNIDDIMDIDETIKAMDSEIKGNVRFVNGDIFIKGWAKRIAKNGRPDEIEVKAAGEEDQKGTKVDIFVRYNNPETGPAPRVIRHISLKTGSNLVGQASPRTFEGLQKFMTTLGVTLDPIPNYGEDIQGDVEKVMSDIADDYGALTAGKNDEKQQKVINNIVRFMETHVALEDKKLLIVNVEKGDYSAQRVEKLRNALPTVDLETTYQKTGSRPDVRVHLAGKRNNYLWKIRYSQSGDRINSKGKYTPPRPKLVVEVGPLFKELASVKIQPKAEPQMAQPNDPNAKVEENLMTPKPEFGPTFDIVDDLHIYMRNDPDAYRKSYYPMLCNMQKALENKEKISVKKMMMPTIKQCGADYNKKFGLASNIDEIMTMEQARELAKKIYDEEVPLMRKGAYK